MIILFIKRILPMIISVALLVAVIAVTKQNVTENKVSTTEPIQTSATIKQKEELRAVWVTYMDLDMQSTDMSYKSFIKKFKNIADTSKEKGFNTLIVQVRPFSDAFYESQYYPYSHLLTGTQGKDPGYDPLKYMCYYADKIGMKIHAWVNPYRIKISKSPKKLAENHPYLNNKNIGIEYDGDIYLNPSSTDARELIKNGIREIVKNYDVDGIQFDDYFYPTTDTEFDKSYYENYVENVGTDKAISLQEWRITQVNILIAETYNVIHSLKDDVVFGISPQGNIENDYEMCADVKNWCSKYGYIDYICPQLYYSLENPALTFEDALNNWLSLEYCEDVELYIGIAGYKIGTDSDEGTWQNSDTILSAEVKLIRKNKLNGFMFYSFANLESETAEKEVANLVKTVKSE